MTDLDHIVNPSLLEMTKQAGHLAIGGFRKQAFIPGGDPGMGGGGGAPPGGDPAAGGGAPPPGGDPAAGGGAPPPGGGGGGGNPGGGMDAAQVQQMIQQAMMMQGGGAGGGAGAGAKGLTPKIDEKAVMLQILKILARIADQLNIKIPASEMVVNQQDMMGLAQASSTGQPLPGMDPNNGAGAGGGGAIGGMPPMDPMQGAGQPGMGGEKAGSYRPNGTAFDTGGLAEIGNKAAAIRQLRAQRS